MDHSSDNYSTDDQWHKAAHGRSQADAVAEGEELEEDFDLSEILAELDDETSLEEAKKKDEEEKTN